MKSEFSVCLEWYSCVCVWILYKPLTLLNSDRLSNAILGFIIKGDYYKMFNLTFDLYVNMERGRQF
jgi:hypothetical protein